MKKGKIIECPICKKEKYIFPSRFGRKSYCGSACARKDNFGFKSRYKNCKICNAIFQIKTGTSVNTRTCSYECSKSNRLLISRKRSGQKKIITCSSCKKSFIGKAVTKRTGKCPDCVRESYRKNRIGKNNPNFRGGLYSKDGLYKNKLWGSSKIANSHLQACANYRTAFLKKNEFLFCELCKVNRNGTPRFEVHHIYFASRYPRHPNLHDNLNLILLCKKCHLSFHAGNKYKIHFLKLEKDRGLKALFANKKI